MKVANKVTEDKTHIGNANKLGWSNRCAYCNNIFKKAEGRKSNYYPPNVVCSTRCLLLKRLKESK